MRGYADAIEALEAKNMDAPFPTWMAVILMDNVTASKMSLVPEDRTPSTLGRGNIDQQSVIQIFHEEYEPKHIKEMARSILENLKTTRDWVMLQSIDPDLKARIVKQIIMDDGMVTPTKKGRHLEYRSDYAEYTSPWMPVGEVAQ